MQQVPGESQDHRHHRGVFFGHGSINGVDFWREPPSKAGRIVHATFEELQSGRESALIRTRNSLLAPEGSRLGAVELSIRVLRSPHGRTIDFDVTLIATEGELVLGDTKEGTMALRVPDSMIVRHSQPGAVKPYRMGEGRIINSEGQRDDDAWGRRAKWVDYFGPVNGRTVGVALFDHPANPRHPTWWHVRDYGLLAANPFGVHDFERLENPDAGVMRIPARQSRTFRYRLFLHMGDPQAAKVGERYADYAAER